MSEVPTPSDLLTQLLSSEYFKIDDRFPVKDGNELFTLVFDLLFNHQVTRIPIIGMVDGSTFAFAKLGEKVEHRQLMTYLAKLGYSDETVAFTTALEFISRTAPNRPYLRLETDKGEWFISLKRSSDVINKPVTAEQLQQLFNLPGVTVVD